MAGKDTAGATGEPVVLLGGDLLAVSRDGDPNLESRSLSELAFDPHRTAVVLGHVLHDRQAESGPARVPRPRSIDPVEALEDAPLVAGGDPDPRVANGQDGRVRLDRKGNLDR